MKLEHIQVMEKLKMELEAKQMEIFGNIRVEKNKELDFIDLMAAYLKKPIRTIKQRCMKAQGALFKHKYPLIIRDMEDHSEMSSLLYQDVITHETCNAIATRELKVNEFLSARNDSGNLIALASYRTD